MSAAAIYTMAGFIVMLMSYGLLWYALREATRTLEIVTDFATEVRALLSEQSPSARSSPGAREPDASSASPGDGGASGISFDQCVFTPGLTAGGISPAVSDPSLGSASVDAGGFVGGV